MGLGCDVPPVHKSFRYEAKTDTLSLDNAVMGVSLGVHVEGAVNFWPDTTCADGAVLGVMKRIAADMPPIDEDFFAEFEVFAKEFIINHLGECVLTSDADLSLETWLAGTNYPGSRKEELRKVWAEFQGVLRNKDFDVMSHVKFETYPLPKFFRGIYSRSDVFKCYFGPICAAIGKKFFHLKWFVKYLDAAGKLERMRELFDNDCVRIFSNDFTSFEATFVKMLMRIEVFFFAFCLQCIGDRDEIMRNIKRTKFGMNRLVFRKFYVWLQSKRYSGEMDTSLCNSLLNLLFVCFLLHKAGHPEEFYTQQFPPQIEGDDCLGAFIYPLDDKVLLRLGAKAKLEYFDTFNEASFCGMVFSSDTVNIIRDPISAMLDFGYAPYRYLGCSHRTKLKLIRAKALSLLFSYPGCPVLKSLACYGLRITAHISNKHAIHKMIKGDRSGYTREKWLQLMDKSIEPLVSMEVAMSSRLLMEDKFSVTVDDQKAIESYLDKLDFEQPLDIPAFAANAGSQRAEHYYNFVLDRRSAKGLQSFTKKHIKEMLDIRDVLDFTT